MLDAYGPLPQARRKDNPPSPRVSPALQQTLRRVVEKRERFVSESSKDPEPPLIFRHVSLSPGAKPSWFRAIAVERHDARQTWFFITISPGDYQLALEEEGNVVPLFLKPDAWKEGYGPVRVGAVDDATSNFIEDKRFDGRSYVTQSRCSVSFVADSVGEDSQAAKKRKVMHSCGVFEANK